MDEKNQRLEQALLRERAERLRENDDARDVAAGERLYCSFTIGDHRFAVPCADAIGTIGMVLGDLGTSLPAWCSGVIVWRGEAVACVNAAVLCGFSDAAAASAIVLRPVGKNMIALCADDLEIVNIDEATVESIDQVSAPRRPWLAGRDGDGRWHLDTDRLIEAVCAQLATGGAA